MSTAKRKLLKVKEAHLNPMPLPESLERAFSEIEKPIVRYADSETPARTEGHATPPKTVKAKGFYSAR